jgi:hypothetical protein
MKFSGTKFTGLVAQRLFAVRFLLSPEIVVGLGAYKTAQRRVAVLPGPASRLSRRPVSGGRLKSVLPGGVAN